MIKRYLMLLVLLIALPGFASAWTVNSKTSPTTGSGTISPAGNKTYVNGVDSGTYTVTATAPGKKIARVTIDGVTVTTGTAPNIVNDVSGTYTVPYVAGKSYRYIVAYFTAATFNITTSAGSGGIVREDTFETLTNIPFGANRQILIKANPGYTIDLPVTAAGANVTDNADGSKTATYTNLQADQTVSATFSLIPVVIASAGNDINITTATGGTLYGSATSNQAGPITYAWSGVGLTFSAPPADPPAGPGVTAVSATAAGNYTATLSVTSGAVTVTDVVTVTVADARLVDIAVCTACHSSNPVVSDFNASPHNTTTYREISCQTCHTGTTQHTVMPANATCTSCHGGAHPAHGGDVAYVSCLTCHDPHSLVATAPIASCAACHTTATPTITAAWSEGPHAVVGHSTGTCQRCHGLEGAVAGATAGWTGSYADLTANKTAVWGPVAFGPDRIEGTSSAPSTDDLVSTAGVSCAACHDQEHGGNVLRPVNTYVGGQVVAWDPNGNSDDDQYDLCTSCHTLTDNTGAVVGNYHDGSSMDVTRTISDSHYDNPAITTVVEGYVVRANSANPCADCHSVHMGDVEIQNAWAASAHAGKIAVKKTEAACTESITWFNANYDPDVTSCTESKIDIVVLPSTRKSSGTVLELYGKSPVGIAFYKTKGALDDLDGNAWVHYNWDQTTDTVPGDRTGRASCQRCHTATGAANFMANPTGYVAANNNFSHLSGWTAATGSPQQELLYCWGCHSDAGTGELRTPGAITEVYAAATSGNTTGKATVAYPNTNASNVCMSCHLGREVGDNVKNDNDADGIRSFINSHYLTAGSTIFGVSGYEYAGQTYSAGFHQNVGQANAYGTGTAGPCVTCHMTGAEAHSFEVLTANGAPATEQCNNCHDGLDATDLNNARDTFETALHELQVALEAKGIYYYGAHPYFYNAPYVVGGTNTAFTAWATPHGLAKWKDVMGAAFNYNVFHHDPGAYAHNRQYALKLITDSIDFLADGSVDGAGVFTINNVSENLLAEAKEAAEAGNHVAFGVTDCTVCHTSGVPGVTAITEPQHNGGKAFHKAQYVSDASLPVTCNSCHGSNSNTTILAQFATSGHADTVGDAWRQFDWRSANRASCQRCHTGTGFVDKLDIADTSNSFVNSDVLKPGEVLNCSTCHTDVTSGGLRTASATFSSGSIDYTVVGASSLCARCHGGRESGNAIKTDPNTTGIRAFISPHFLAAAATLYNKGYEFSGMGSYDLGDNKNLGAGGQGPCVNCHMDAGNHSMTAAAPVDAATRKADVEAGLVNLKAALAAKGIHYSDKHPYFYTAPYVGRDEVTGSFSVNNAFTNWAGVYGSGSWKDVMGAAFNYQLLLNEPGAYAHNYEYTTKLITDSIDFLTP